MRYAIDLAYSSDPLEVPVAAVIAINNEIISFSDNRVERDNIEWHHAEFLAIIKAIQNLNTKYLVYYNNKFFFLIYFFFFIVFSFFEIYIVH